MSEEQKERMREWWKKVYGLSGLIVGRMGSSNGGIYGELADSPSIPHREEE